MRSSNLRALVALAAAIPITAHAAVVQPEEHRPLYPTSMLWGGDGRYDPRIPYSRRSSQRERRKLLRRGAR